jgi:hypothetical protein
MKKLRQTQMHQLRPGKMNERGWIRMWGGYDVDGMKQRLDGFALPVEATGVMMRQFD